MTCSSLCKNLGISRSTHRWPMYCCDSGRVHSLSHEHSQKLVGPVELFPHLRNLLRTCRFLNVPITSLIASSGPLRRNVDAAKEAIARAGSRRISMPEERARSGKALEKALLDPVPLSFVEVARRLGYKKHREALSSRSGALAIKLLTA